MDWNTTFSQIKSADEAKKQKQKEDSAAMTATSKEGHEKADNLLKNVVMPLFNEVAKAAKNNGYNADAKCQVATMMSLPGSPSLATGAKLTLESKSSPPIPGKVRHALVEVQCLHGSTYSLKTFDGATEFSGGIKESELTTEHLSSIVSKVVSQFFK